MVMRMPELFLGLYGILFIVNALIFYYSVTRRVERACSGRPLGCFPDCCLSHHSLFHHFLYFFHLAVILLRSSTFHLPLLAISWVFDIEF